MYIIYIYIQMYTYIYIYREREREREQEAEHLTETGQFVPGRSLLRADFVPGNSDISQRYLSGCARQSRSTPRSRSAQKNMDNRTETIRTTISMSIIPKATTYEPMVVVEEGGRVPLLEVHLDS